MKQRPAFTLIETVLALGLSSGLLLVIFSLVNSTAHYQITSQDQIMSSQRLLGLMQDLRYDVQLAVTDPAWLATKRKTQFADEVVPQEQVADRSTTDLRVRSLETFASPVGLVGTRDALLLTLARNNPRFERPRVVGDVQGSETDGLHQQVLWTHSRTLPLTLPTQVAGETFLSKTFNRQPADGLLRLESHRAAASRGSINDGLAHVTTCDVVGDASNVRFRYSDGQTWLDSWNSTDRKCLPASIEVSFEETNKSHIHRWVIALIQSSAKGVRAPAQGSRS